MTEETCKWCGGNAVWHDGPSRVCAKANHVRVYEPGPTYAALAADNARLASLLREARIPEVAPHQARAGRTGPEKANARSPGWVLTVRKDEGATVKQQRSAVLTQLQLREAILEWAIANGLVTRSEASRSKVTTHASGGAKIKVQP